MDLTRLALVAVIVLAVEGSKAAWKMDGGLLVLVAVIGVGVLVLRSLARARRRPRPAPDALVRVALAQNDADAVRLRDALQHVGIRSMLRTRDDLSAARGLGFSAPSSLEILVWQHDAERAEAVVQSTPPAVRPARGRRPRH
jgi:hypothetical protein